MSDSIKRRFDIARLLATDLAGTLSGSEKEELNSWLSESADNQQEYMELKSAWDSGEALSPYPEEIVQKQWKHFNQRKRRRLYRRVYYAAAILLLIGLGGYISQHYLTKEYSGYEHSVPVIASGAVRLTLSGGESLILDNSVREIKEIDGGILELDGNVLDYTRLGSQSSALMNKLEISRGGEFQLYLEDGTKVWLNSMSELKYPVRFDLDKREVWLQGEAYFEVNHSSERPFIVHISEEVEVTVLGTIFNISSYPEEYKITTTLLSGKIQVGFPGDSIIIQPNEQLVYNSISHNYEVNKVEACLYAAWKDGELLFRDETLENIMNRLKRWYDLDVIFINDDLKQVRMEGDLKKYENFDKIVRMLEEVGGFDVIIRGKTIIIGTK